MSKKDNSLLVLCPFCEYEFIAKKKYVHCEMCGNGYVAKHFEFTKNEESVLQGVKKATLLGMDEQDYETMKEAIKILEDDDNEIY